MQELGWSSITVAIQMTLLPTSGIYFCKEDFLTTEIINPILPIPKDLLGSRTSDHTFSLRKKHSKLWLDYGIRCSTQKK